jgi:hypothetical protein
MRFNRKILVFAILLGCGPRDVPLLGGVTVPLDAQAVDVAWPADCSGVAASWCVRLAECRPLTLPTDYGDDARCIVREALRCQVATQAAGASAVVGGVAGSIAQAPCDVIVPGSLEAFLPVGTNAMGASCGLSSQCESGSCVVNSPKVCGNCAARAATGEVCSAPNSCPAGDFCAYHPGSGPTCQAPAANGMACGPGCRHGLACVGNVCKAAGKNGAACTDSEPCDPALGLRCADGHCTPISLGAPGEACDVNGLGSAQIRLCRHGACVGLNDLGRGHCSVFSPDTGLCDLNTGPACEPPAVCLVSAKTGEGSCRVLDGACP